MDIEKIEQLIQVVKGAEISELCLESADGKVCVKKGRKQVNQAKRQAAVSAKKTAKTPENASASSNGSKEAVIIAPMVGIFHSFNGSIGVGAVIKAGQVVGSIESMKLMNDVTADVDGTVEEVMIEDGMPVEYGQSLLKLALD